MKDSRLEQETSSRNAPSSVSRRIIESRVGREPSEEQERGRDFSRERHIEAGAEGAEILLGLFRGLRRVSQAQTCAAKAPDKFVETPRANIVSWLEVAETYLQATQVPKSNWAATLLTYLSEGPLVRLRGLGCLKTRQTTRNLGRH